MREYFEYSNTVPEEDYYELEDESLLRRHLFEAVVALLLDYELGIEHHTTDEAIYDLDLVYLYKELHKINLLTNTIIYSKTLLQHPSIMLSKFYLNIGMS